MGLLEQIKEAGIIGCGGAGFPTHAKLSGEVTYLLVNGAECEPLLRTDRYLMKHRASDLVRAVDAVGALTKAQHRIICLKNTYHEEIASLEAAIKAAGSGIRLHKLFNYYPAGDEQALVCDVTGKTVPPAGIPLDVGCVVSNVASMIGISEAMNDIPFTEKYLTVTGEVREPLIIKAPIGTPVSECIEAAGGSLLADYHILIGGPLMGKLYKKEELDTLFVTKTTSGVVIVADDTALVLGKEFPLERAKRMARVSCIQCERCTEMCPRFLIGHPLQPHKIMRAVAYSDDVEQMMQHPDVKDALICSECGLCEVYACPMMLSPRKVNQFFKGEFRKAGVRYERREKSWEPRTERDWRRVNSHRLASRLDVERYYDYDIDKLVTLSPKEVHISVAQHIGAPGEIKVGVGDKVQKGSLIGAIPEKALSANTHSSVDGTVSSVDGMTVTIKTA